MLEPLQFISVSALNASIVVAPALLYAAVKRSRAIAVASLLTFVIFVVQGAVLSMPSFGPLASLKYNWLQKLTVVVLTILAARFLQYKNEDWGFKRANSPIAYAVAIVVGIATSVITYIEIFSKHEPGKFNPEYFFFEMTMPGLHEELLYRGVLLCLWDRAAGTPFRLFDVKFGVGTIISAALFTMGHTVLFDHDFKLMVAPIETWLDMASFALAVTWLRYKFASVWPPLIAHNFGNVSAHLVHVAL